jgi:hypothetical protein
MANEQRPGEVDDPLEATGIGRSIELRPGGQLGAAEPLEPPVAADFPAFRRLTFFSVLGGVCPLLPEAVGEGSAVEAVCTRMVAELGASRDLSLEPEEVQILAAAGNGDGAHTSRPSPLTRLQHLLRRPFPRFAVQDEARRSAEVFGRGYLLLHAAGLEMAELHPPDRTATIVRQVRAAVDETLRAGDERTLENTIAPIFRRSASLMRRAADLLAGFLRRAPGPGVRGITPGSGALAAESELLSGLVDQIAAALWNDREALAGLEKSFETELARQRGLSVLSAGS